MLPFFTPALEVPACIIQASNDYSIPPRALLAIWLTEGGGTGGTVNKNKNGTADYGPMQINTIWANKLQKQFNVTTTQLTNDFCLSVRAGAYILRYEINAAGGNFWEGVGRYHSRAPELKSRYIQQVYKNSLKF